MKCIEQAAYVIATVCYPGEYDESNREIAKKNILAAVDHDGIQTLLLASDAYTGGDDTSELKAARRIWNALGNFTGFDVDAERKAKIMPVFDSGIDDLAQLRAADDTANFDTMDSVFTTLYTITRNNYATKNEFKDKNILSTCLEVFKKDDVWSRTNEAVVAKFL